MLHHEPTTQMYDHFITAVEETAAETLQTDPKVKIGQQSIGKQQDCRSKERC
jgi:hypothetical protein